MMGSLLAHLARESSYLQLYWLLQTGRVAALAVYRMVTRNRPCPPPADPDRKRGWLEFRKHTKLHNSMAFIWSLYVLWGAINAYFFDVPPSERFQNIVDFVTPPKQTTVDGWCTCIAAALYVTHCTHRLYDGLRVSIFSDVTAVDLITFLSDLAFPVAAGLSLIDHSPDFHLLTDADLLSSLHWYHAPAFVAFAFASKVQLDTFQQLQKLRRNRHGHIVTTAHKLPLGGWFEKLNVSAPHYFAEIVVHLAVGVALGMRSSTWWMLTAYLVLNHVQLAANKQRFYRQKFDDFPKHRKMLIPYIL